MGAAMTTTIQTIQSRTKSGKTITVAIIPVSRIPSTEPERRNYEASGLAVAAGATGPRSWRLVDENGAVIQLPMRTSAEAAATSGPASDRHDW